MEQVVIMYVVEINYLLEHKMFSDNILSYYFGVYV